MADDITIRPVRPDDRSGVVALLARALDRGDDPRFEALYRWKHETNPFGASPSMVAEADGHVVGFRGLMRWEFAIAGVRVTAVRAVDTATDEAHRGRGIFTRLN